MFPVPAESDGAFAARLEILSGELEALQNGSSDLLSLIGGSRPLSGEIREAAGRLTWEKYRFRAEWVPGWYSSRRTGFWSAGILLEVDGSLPLLFLHGKFARRRRRLGYDAAETLAHELIHAVRTAFPASVYEEYFPARFMLRHSGGSAGIFSGSGTSRCCCSAERPPLRFWRQREVRSGFCRWPDRCWSSDGNFRSDAACGRLRTHCVAKGRSRCRFCFGSRIGRFSMRLLSLRRNL